MVPTTTMLSNVKANLSKSTISLDPRAVATTAVLVFYINIGRPSNPMICLYFLLGDATGPHRQIIIVLTISWDFHSAADRLRSPDGIVVLAGQRSKVGAAMCRCNSRDFSGLCHTNPGLPDGRVVWIYLGLQVSAPQSLSSRAWCMAWQPFGTSKHK